LSVYRSTLATVFRKDKLMKRLTTIAMICLALAISAVAQSNQGKPPEAKPAEALPSVDQILDKFTTALGGKAAIEKQTSRVSKGTFDIPAMGASGAITLYGKAPNKNLVVIEIPGFGTINQGYNGSVGWAQDPTSGLREITGGELAAAKREAEFYSDLKFKELFPKMVVKGKEKVGASDAYVIEATPAEGSPQKFYFDVETGLLARVDVEAVSPQGKIPFEVYLEDYKAVDGVKMPFTVRRTSPAISFTIKLDKVEHNVAIDDAKFNKPAGQ
jgi:outer membrane lipoprotein-sorting protein